MSTRSGKRIHASLDNPVVDTDTILESDRKTRSKKQKYVEMSVMKKHNYVSYPTDEDTASVYDDADTQKTVTRGAGKIRRNTLKDHNVDEQLSNNLESNENNKSIRKTRSGKKHFEEPDIENNQNYEKAKPDNSDKKKNNKKKKKLFLEMADTQSIKSGSRKKKRTKKLKRLNSCVINGENEENFPTSMINTSKMSADSFHSAAGSPLNCERIENDQAEVAGNIVEHEIRDNFCTTLIDENNEATTSNTIRNLSLKKERKSSIKNSTFESSERYDTVKENVISTFDKTSNVKIAFTTTADIATKNKKKSLIKNSSFDKINNIGEDNLNRTFDKTTDTSIACNGALRVSIRNKRKSHNKKSTFDKIDTKNLDLNTTFDKTFDISNTINTKVDVSRHKRSVSNMRNFTSDKVNRNETNIADDKKYDLTFNNTVGLDSLSNNKTIDIPIHKDCNILSDSYDNFNILNIHESNPKRKSNAINSTFEQIEKYLENNESIQENSLFDKDGTGTLSSIFDSSSLQVKGLFKKSKIANNPILTTTGQESSLIGKDKIKCLDSTFDKDSNIELNTTFDTQDKTCEPKESSLESDSIINITFDKSQDNSRINITSDESKTEKILNYTPVLIESSVDESVISEDKTPKKPEVTLTPLKREGTFTKEIQDIVTLPKPVGSAQQTPVKRKSSIGNTSFPHSKSSTKEKTTLNVTRSLEKLTRRSFLDEAGPRHTRVMFCSPVNNPTIVSQVKGRVIKSNLKGSNKSFIFDDSESSVRRAGRKRSLTVGETETRSKRKRLGDELQHSVDRLSRPRTMSAAAKLPDLATPSKKFGTPSKAKPEGKVSRTKLPNFAALHQKQFAKMESLDECQERKAKRARQLLTPTGTVGLLERISPKDTLPKAEHPTKEPSTKLQTPSKRKLPTLDSLIPGYTRFGFKLNMDANPFSIAKKIEAKKKTPQMSLSRQIACVPLPSLTGATTNRRDVAKQAVMREKSFTEKRDVKRKESRTLIKGVRTNRRFELQMQLRNLNA